MRRLIVNADGFGFTEGVNRGIVEAVEGGLVHSTSCVVNFPAIEELPAFAAHWPHVSPGVHFNLSVGRPVCDPGQVRTLVDGEGLMFGDRLPRRLLTGAVEREHIRRELRAQLGRMVTLGVTPTHWDGHQNKHLYAPFFQEALAVARSGGVRRMRRRGATSSRRSRTAPRVPSRSGATTPRTRAEW